IVDLVEVAVEVIELPRIMAEIVARRMEAHGLVAVLHQATMAEHLEILRLLLRRRLGPRETLGKAGALDRHLLDAVDRLGRLDADDVEQGRREVAGVAELVAQLAARLDALAPGHDQRIADAAA